MPELVGAVVAERREVARCDFAVGLDVGGVGQLVVLEAVRPALDLAEPEVERTEGLRIADLLVLVERLATEGSTFKEFDRRRAGSLVGAGS